MSAEDAWLLGLGRTTLYEIVKDEAATTTSPGRITDGSPLRRGTST